MKGFCLANGGLSQRWTAQYRRCPGHSWLARRWEQLIRPRLGDDAGDDAGDEACDYEWVNGGSNYDSLKVAKCLAI